MSDPTLPFNVRQVRIRMHHTDAMGAVYHGTYFPLFDEARTEVFRDLGYTWRDAVEGEGRAMVIVHEQPVTSSGPPGWMIWWPLRCMWPA